MAKTEFILENSHRPIHFKSRPINKFYEFRGYIYIVMKHYIGKCILKIISYAFPITVYDIITLKSSLVWNIYDHFIIISSQTELMKNNNNVTPVTQRMFCGKFENTKK